MLDAGPKSDDAKTSGLRQEGDLKLTFFLLLNSFCSPTHMHAQFLFSAS